MAAFASPWFSGQAGWAWNGIDYCCWIEGPLMKLPPFDYEAPETVAAAVGCWPSIRTRRVCWPEGRA